MKKILMALVLVAALASTGSVALANEGNDRLPSSETTAVAPAQAEGLIPAGPSTSMPINLHEDNKDTHSDL